MHELGVLKYALKTVQNVAQQNNIEKVKFITLDVGEESSYVPSFFEKLYPIAVEGNNFFKDTKLIIDIVPGKNLVVKEIGY